MGLLSQHAKDSHRDLLVSERSNKSDNAEDQMMDKALSHMLIPLSINDESKDEEHIGSGICNRQAFPLHEIDLQKPTTTNDSQ